jgi:hypothetical protein
VRFVACPDDAHAQVGALLRIEGDGADDDEPVPLLGPE